MGITTIILLQTAADNPSRYRILYPHHVVLDGPLVSRRWETGRVVILCNLH
jgi:hypothetical protein